LAQQRRIVGLAMAVAFVATVGLIPATASAATCPATDGASLTADLGDATCTAITLAAGTYTSASGFTAPARSVSIFGPGANSANITSTAGDVFTVPVPALMNFALSGVTLGDASSGAGLNVTGSGTTALSNDVISGNTSSASGAGIAFSGGTLTVSNSIITGNTTSGNGGGVENSSATGTATFSQVLFVGNGSTGTGSGGAVDTSGLTATTNLKNVTFTQNHADANGGALRSSGASATTTLNNVTIANNVANNDNSGGGDGGGIANSGGTINIANSIVANDLAPGGGAPDCTGTITRTGYELIRDPTGCTLAGSTTGYLTGVDPLLGSLAGNGGTLANGPPLQTMALEVGSPAVNAGNLATPTGGSGTCETLDQRSRQRIPAAVQPCDLGAYEAQPAICHGIFMTIGIGQATPVTLDCTGDPFVYAIASGPANGALTGFDSLTGDVTYTPNAGFTGADSFTYQAVNGPLSSGPSSVTFSIKGPTPPTPATPEPAPTPFNLKAAIKKCKRKVPKGPKRTKCIKKAKKRARAG
jgi:predicted outer membrane repeat protein